MKKLGKRKPKIDKRTFKLSRYLVALPPIPSAIDWGGKVLSWGEMLNSDIGDCTCAAAGHLIMDWSSNTGTEIIPPDSDILTAYEAVSGYDGSNPNTDNGADMLTVLNYWRNTGISNHKILAYAQVEPDNISHIKSAIYLFGGIYVGVQLPESCLESTGTWSNTTDTNIAGGHAIPIVAYDKDSLTCVTWGALQRLTWPWLQKYCDESYLILSQQDWISTSGQSPSQLDLQSLQADLNNL